MWFAADVFRQAGCKQKCLMWTGPFFSGATIGERKAQVVGAHNKFSSSKTVVIGGVYVQLCIQHDTASKYPVKALGAPAIRAEGWSITVYEYIGRSWAVAATFG